MKYTKNDFITAYCATYNSTKKQAEAAHKAATAGYIEAIIDGFRQNARKAFYQD